VEFSEMQGKNFIVAAKKVVLEKRTLIDVSGKSSTHVKA
jgi:hypothetical protein